MATQEASIRSVLYGLEATANEAVKRKTGAHGAANKRHRESPREERSGHVRTATTQKRGREESAGAEQEPARTCDAARRADAFLAEMAQRMAGETRKRRREPDDTEGQEATHDARREAGKRHASDGGGTPAHRGRGSATSAGTNGKGM